MSNNMDKSKLIFVRIQMSA